MSGSVLLVDDVSTSRIILKVKLSAAYYTVSQAATLADAVAAMRRDRPDIVLVSGSLVGDNLSGSLKALRTASDGQSVPTVLLADAQSGDMRISGLRCGYDDVITCPAQEHFLLARLRSLLRQHGLAQDLRRHSATAGILGFADSQRGFTRPAQIALVTDNPARSARLRRDLGRITSHRFELFGAEKLMTPERQGDGRRGGWATAPDLVIADTRYSGREEGARLVADLRASQRTRDSHVLPLLEQKTDEIAATLLDMGVDEVLSADMTPEEIALRLETQLNRKRTSDMMRNQIEDSLQAAITDPLTGLYNRRYGLSFLKCLLTEDERPHRDFAVMVADLDHFKSVNDTYGHAAGDAVLVQVAHALHDCLRPEDVVARIGGEEFLLIVPDVKEEAAHRLAQKLCDAVGALSLHLPGRERKLAVTISIGVSLARAQACGAAASEARSRQLLEQADRALYVSKAEGRNTVTLSARSAA